MTATAAAKVTRDDADLQAAGRTTSRVDVADIIGGCITLDSSTQKQQICLEAAATC